MSPKDLAFTTPRAPGSLPPPPPRFQSASFANYSPTHPSQEEAVGRLQDLIASITRPDRPRRLFRLGRPKPLPAGSLGLYLDGGFGVGKTHLLAATFHAASLEPRVFMSFQELVYRTGVRGIANTADDLRGVRLLCLDEFELDDPGNTLIVKSVLQHLFSQGTAVVTTSNTPAAAQGEGRFNAQDFQREIQGIAANFTHLRLDGPDWRMRHGTGPAPSFNLSPGDLPAGPAPHIRSSWPELLGVLRQLHPATFGDLLGRIGSLSVHGMDTIDSQADALRFVHFIDRLYDLKVSLRFSLTARLAADLSALFAPEYCNSAYQKKHDRCLSRLIELHRESAPESAGVAATQ